MNVDCRWGIAPQRKPYGRAPRAEDILFHRLVGLLIDVDPTEAARVILAEVPSLREEVLPQTGLRGFLIELSEMQPPGQTTGAYG